MLERITLHYRKFDDGGFIHIYQDICGDIYGLKGWEGELKLKRKRKIPESAIDISKYFLGYNGKAFIRLVGRGILKFYGTGPLRYKKRRIA